MDEKIEIITKYHNKPPRADGKISGVDYVERTVTINGKIMYTDRIDVQMYKAGDDPVSRFRNWLYGRDSHRTKIEETVLSCLERLLQPTNARFNQKVQESLVLKLKEGAETDSANA